MPASPSGKVSRGGARVSHPERLPGLVRDRLRELQPTLRPGAFLGIEGDYLYFWDGEGVQRIRMPGFDGGGPGPVAVGVIRRIAVVGSRAFGNPALVRAFIRSRPIGDTIISGHARGVDMVAELAAKARGLPVISIPADWATGRAAGFARNQRVVDAADAVVAFWDGKSRGTRDAIAKAIKAGKPTIVYDQSGRIVERHNISGG